MVQATQWWLAHQWLSRSTSLLLPSLKSTQLLQYCLLPSSMSWTVLLSLAEWTTKYHPAEGGNR